MVTSQLKFLSIYLLEPIWRSLSRSSSRTFNLNWKRLEKNRLSLRKHFGNQIQMMKSNAQIAKNTIWQETCISSHAEAFSFALIVRHWLEFSHKDFSRMMGGNCRSPLTPPCLFEKLLLSGMIKKQYPSISPQYSKNIL